MNTFSKYITIVFASVLIVVVSNQALANPSSSFYMGSPFPPINSGTESQTKSGSLTVASSLSPSAEYGFIAVNGGVSVNTTLSGAAGTKLNINGRLKIFDGTQGTGRLLRSDARGVATWVPATSYLTKKVVIAFDGPSCPAGWTKYSEADGRVLVGTGNSMTTGSVDVLLNEQKGTEKEILNNDEMAFHIHSFKKVKGDDVQGGSESFPVLGSVSTSGTFKPDGTLVPEPQTPHNNMQPYVVATYCFINL